MKEFPRGGLIGKAFHMAETVRKMHIPQRAAYAAYFIVLSVFPALLLILSSLRYTGLSVEDLMEFLGGVLPRALMEGAEELVYSTYRNASGAVAGLSAVTALWSSSRGVYGLLTGLNAVYGVSENRGYIYTRSISVVYALVFYAVILLTLGLHVFGNSLMNFLLRIDNAVVIFLLDFIDLRFFLLLFVQTVLFTVMYMALPNGRTGFSISKSVSTHARNQIRRDVHSGLSAGRGRVYAQAAGENAQCQNRRDNRIVSPS